MTARVELENISKHYGTGVNRVTALRDISLIVEEGEFLAIQGPSGSGKSTLLSICGLIDFPDCGAYRLNGQSVTQLSIDSRCNQRRWEIGFIFQRHQLIPTMTVYENVAYPLFLNGAKSREIRSKVELLLEKIGLSSRRKHLPRQLSGGERQRVGIARALIKQPKLIIADEPSANLDHGHSHASLKLMRELNKEQGASFIIATHDTFVIEHCDRTIQLIDGSMEASR